MEMKMDSNFRKQISDLKAAVLMGGVGEERQISIESGKNVAEALSRGGLDVVTSDISPNNLAILEESDIDVFFVSLHGRFGEDGQLQRIMEGKSLSFTGSGSKASGLAFNKIAAKELFQKAGVRVARSVRFDIKKSSEETKSVISGFGDKFVVKPSRQGSTIGVDIVQGAGKAVERAEICQEKYGECMIEEYIPGRELTVGILDGGALPIIEIRSKRGFYDYQAKYYDEGTQFAFDTIDSEDLVDEIKASAVNCFNVLGCRHFGRVDFILNEKGEAYALELNSIPGLTEHSLIPKAAAGVGIGMKELCVRLIELALEDTDSGITENQRVKSGS